jgi:hypothetical protein
MITNMPLSYPRTSAERRCIRAVSKSGRFLNNRPRNILASKVSLLYTLASRPGIGEHTVTLAFESKPKSIRRDHLVVEELGTELLIYDQKRTQAFCLNEKAAFVWQHCDGKTTVAEISAQLSKSLDERVNDKVVEFALQTLSREGLLEPSQSSAPTGMTRRDLIQEIGVRAAVALPVVTALFVSAPKAHASGKPGWSDPPPPPPPHHGF